MEENEPAVMLLDALELQRSLDPNSTFVLTAKQFPPLCAPHGVVHRPETARSSLHPDSILVENELGLCTWAEAAHRVLKTRFKIFCASWRLEGSNVDQKKLAPRVPDLAAAVHAQQYVCMPMRHADCTASAPICPPLLFCALIHNCADHDVLLWALDCAWIVPKASSFCLSPLKRWRELVPLRPAGGYRLVLLDPPWHSWSARRKGLYKTIDNHELLAQA